MVSKLLGVQFYALIYRDLIDGFAKVCYIAGPMMVFDVIGVCITVNVVTHVTEITDHINYIKSGCIHYTIHSLAYNS